MNIAAIPGRLQYQAGKEICHQEDTARGGSKAEAEEEKETDLRWPG